MDPTSLGFVAVIAVLIIIISIIVFKMYPKETDFEKAYGENALRLLTEDRANKTKSAKNKNKGKNGDKKRDLGAEEKQNRNEKPANGDLHYIPLSTNGHCGTEGWNGTNNGEVDGKPNHKKLKGKQLVAEIMQHTESAKDEKVAVAKNMEGLSGQRVVAEKLNDEPEVVPSARILHDENKGSDVGERKGKKKNRVRRNKEYLREITKGEVRVTEEIVPAMDVIPPLESEQEKLEKPKSKKPNPLKDINANKLQARLNAIAELEPEYVTFLTNYINNVNTQRAKLDGEIALMRKQIADKDRLVLYCTNKLTTAEQKDSEIAMLQKTLAEEKRKYKMFEQTVCAQLSNNAQEKSYLQRKYDQLQGEFGALREEMKKAQSVIHSAPPPIDTKPYQQQIDRLKAELTSSKNRCSQQELELNQRLQALQQIRKELQNQDCQIEHLSKTNALLEKRLQEVEGNAKAERDTLEKKLQNTMKVAEELSVVTSEIRDEMLQHRGNAETAVQEREKHCEQIHILNAQLMDANRERVRYLNDCAVYSKKLTEMETANAELSEQLKVLQNTSATSDANCSELTKEVEKYRKQLVDIMEAHDKDVAKLKNQLECVQEEKENISKEAVEVAKCRKELNEFKIEYDKKLNRIVSLEEEVAKYKEIEIKRKTMVPSPDNNGTDVNEKMMKHRVQSAAKDDVVCGNNVNLEVTRLKRQNEELRKANYKVVEISQQQEAIFKKHLEELKKKYEVELQQYCCKVFETLCAIAPPNIKLPNLSNIYDMDQFCKWLKNVENVVQKSENVQQFNKNEDDESGNKVDLTKVAELEASNRRYRAALASLSSHIDTIEQEAISKEKIYLSEISCLRHEVNEQLKKRLENEHKRKLELISQASKLCEIINGSQKYGNGGAEPTVKSENAYDFGGANHI
ncbi:hypothetical protein LOAG_05915 [Loa loa]|uniref:Kinectin n=1 Tax=Loa loa TaxID=7209 RepID=A0A1I7VZB8_LOALO|nr:hypothetical protein LOAG_05915 [Loa loa]EFO22569.1 hypothetical protein LOAG_05915 [Loa loa]